MKRSISLKNIFIIAVTCFFGMQIQAQNKEKNKKISIEVKGNCGMCKARIEKAATKVKGVKYVNWNIPSKELILILDENKCTLIEVEEAIANVGHDTDLEKANNKVYNNLPPCCKYRDPNSLKLDHN
ncbi:heavy-metal-associated domain-containing protein [Formosa sp. PL04]|uniref:heavy-metal-associated domain-containing protein n=1 Tax=Formosa sp. PL04 TaxID=3081755 RepID=UPI002981914E|nr:cation transporter [Formosa sp. PL04]MDW5290170.1 metal transporter [Formosa sp. PL04]